MTVTLLLGDVFERLADMPDNLFDCVVTSPPYWGLRDYGVEGQIGLEPTLGEHIDVMVRLFEEVKRVLSPTGTCWINYGDCYATTPNGRSAEATKEVGTDDRTFRDKPFSTVGHIEARRNNGDGQHFDRRGGYLKPKDLCMVPNRLAIALQEAGWWIRSEIIWAKPNPMPESVRDRPATSHEKIFLLTKAPRYFYDAAAVRVERASNEDANGFRGGPYVGVDIRNASCGKRVAVGNKKAPGARSRGLSPRHANHVNHTTLDTHPRGEGRNLRNYEPAPVQVWEIATRPFKEAHFATFPPELVSRCLRAGCPTGGHVLDPFGGAGTTGLVADRLQCDATLIEINPAYVEIARKRIAEDQTPIELHADPQSAPQVQKALL